MCDADDCQSDRLLSLTVEKGDRFFARFRGDPLEDLYAPAVEHITDGMYIEIEACLDCGKIQGSFPVDSPEVRDE